MKGLSYGAGAESCCFSRSIATFDWDGALRTQLTRGLASYCTNIKKTETVLYAKSEPIMMSFGGSE